MLWLDEQMKTLNDAELEDARENDYVWYFDLAMITATTKRDVDAEILRLYDACWPQVKAAMLRDYVHTRADGKTVKPSPSNMMNLRSN